jgi:transcriptional regulator with XRE-family HTH domain
MMAGMATETSLGTRIKRARERLRWTQRQLADALGVNIKTIDNWENDRRKPRSAMGALEATLGPLSEDGPRRPSSTAEEALDRLEQQVALLRQAMRDQAPKDGKSESSERRAV